MSKAQVNKLFADTKSLEEKGKTLEARNQQWFYEAENYIRYLDAENEKGNTLEARNQQWFNSHHTTLFYPLPYELAKNGQRYWNNAYKRM